MDEHKSNGDKGDDVMLPGFRFHPTDEELVGFYLMMKIQQRKLPIELIKQVDIYKYDPWDLPKLATTGEKEWYFYCPRDRKYRNSARPNRVTGAGFWKATGTDRPIYSSDGSKCIGLKKSLVFYRGRAAKGMKTDWMMHEFRLPSISNPAPPNKFIEKNPPSNDAWAICRIFKKPNSMTQRALSHSWVSPDILTQGAQTTHFSPETISCTSETGSPIQFSCNFDLQQQSPGTFSTLTDIPSYNKPLTNQNGEIPSGFMFSPIEMSGPVRCTADVPSIVFNLSPASDSIDFGGSQQQQLNGFTMDEEEMNLKKNSSIAYDNFDNNHWGSTRSIGFPFSLPLNSPEDWKSNLPWDSPPCPSDMSTSFSTNNYT